MKLELMLPGLISGTVLIVAVLFSMRRAIRDSKRLTVELESRAKANFDELMRDCRTELARERSEQAARDAATRAGFDLVLNLEAGADADAVSRRVGEFLDELNEYARVSGGAGLTLDTSRSTAESGVVKLRLVPSDPAHVAKQREFIEAKSRKLAGVSEVKFAAA